MVFQCKNYSEITVETWTQLKSVIFTTDIFAVCSNLNLNSQQNKKLIMFICIRSLLNNFQICSKIGNKRNLGSNQVMWLLKAGRGYKKADESCRKLTFNVDVSLLLFSSTVTYIYCPLSIVIVYVMFKCLANTAAVLYLLFYKPILTFGNILYRLRICR